MHRVFTRRRFSDSSYAKVFVFQDGELVDSVMGREEEALREMIQKVLEKAES